MLNARLTLNGSVQHVHSPILVWLGLGIVPGLLLGYTLMLYLNGSRLWLLELLGCVHHRWRIIYEHLATQLATGVG